MARTNKTTKQQREDAKARLLKMLQPGDTVYTVLRHVAPSGMARWIDLYVFLPYPDNGPRAVTKLWLSGIASTAMGARYDQKRECIRIDGAGMDMGFALVYDLSMTLYGDGYKLKHEWIG